MGFLAAGVKCGIKISGKPDMALLVCPTGATAAAVFTTNKITSAAVEVSREHARSAKVYAVVVKLRLCQRLHRASSAWPTPARCAS